MLIINLICKNLFCLNEEDANKFEPRRKPFRTIIPAFIAKDEPVKDTIIKPKYKLRFYQKSHVRNEIR